MRRATRRAPSGTSRLRSPARSSSPRMPITPPARCTSSTCTSGTDGATLHRHGHAARQPVDVGHGEIDFALVRGGEQMQHGVGRAAHRDVERHRVLERLEAWRSSAAARLRRPPRSSGARDRRSRWPASTNRRLRSAWVATTVPLPGSDRPSASVRQFIELAVNMPEQEPQVGQAERSITATSASETLASPAATIASMRSTLARRRSRA